MRRTGGTGNPPFSWFADLGSRLVVMATTGRCSSHHPCPVPFGEGTSVELGGGWDRSFFWQFVNGTHDTTDCFKKVVPLGRQQLRRIRPLSGGIPCRLFYARRNLPICSLVRSLFQEERERVES
jgi:hypothetical protein